jgi:hypothetical protein
MPQEPRGNRGRSDEARDPNRPTYVDPETGETEKEGLGRRVTETETTETVVEPVEPEQPEG